MTKIIMFNLITLDGYFEGPGRDIEWHNVDTEFNQFAIEQLQSAGMLMFGRVTYQLMESYWPAAKGKTAEFMNSLPKIVVSKTLDKAEWNNTRLIKDNVIEELRSVKNKPGKDIFLFGSSDLARELIAHNLIDEFRILINPVILGKGSTLFAGLENKVSLKLINTRIFTSGNVLLIYTLP